MVRNEVVKKYLPKLIASFALYAKFNLWITDKKMQLVRLVLNRAQRYVVREILRKIAAGIPVRMYVIKGRQLGFTTLFTAFIYWLCSLNKNRRFLFVSHDMASAQNICDRLQSYYYHSHPVLQPEFKKMNREMVHFATPIKSINNGKEVRKDIGLDSFMMVRTADNEHLGKSYTFQGAHLTEFCSWPTLGIDVPKRMISLQQAIPKLPNTFIFIESTAQGENYGKEFWDDPDNGYDKIFVSWLADDEYRTKVTLVDYFELSVNPESKYGDEISERERIISQLQFWYPEMDYYSENCDFPDQEGEDYEVWLQKESMCRLLWRRGKIDTECLGNKWAFKQEYPTIPEDAWGMKTQSIFSAQRLIEMDEYRKKVQKPTRYRYRHDHSVRDCNLKFQEQSYGHLQIFKPPEKEKVYVAGADGAQGVKGGDHSSVVVLELPTLEEVATFSDVIQPAEFAGVCNFLGELYNWCKLGVERNDKGGYAALEYLLKNYRYPNLYYYLHPFKVAISGDVQWGYITNDDTKQIMARDAMYAVDNMDVVVNSEELLSQMKSFVEHPKTKVLAASPGKHDDIVMAWMIAIQMAKDIKIRASSPPPKTVGLTHGYMRQLVEKRDGRSNYERALNKQRRRISY